MEPQINIEDLKVTLASAQLISVQLMTATNRELLKRANKPVRNIIEKTLNNLYANYFKENID